MPLERPGTKGVYRRIGSYVVALEGDTEWKAKGLVDMMMRSDHVPQNLRAAEFRGKWREGMPEEEIVIVKDE